MKKLVHDKFKENYRMKICISLAIIEKGDSVVKGIFFHFQKDLRWYYFLVPQRSFPITQSVLLAYNLLIIFIDLIF